MIRWATEADRWPIIRLMQAAQTGASWLDYRDLDGQCLVDEGRGGLRGYVRFTLGRPETYLRQVVVRPGSQNRLVGAELLGAVVRLAEEYGSQCVEGFQRADEKHLHEMSAKLGAKFDAGVRVRFPLGGANKCSKIARRMARKPASASRSTVTSSGT